MSVMSVLGIKESNELGVISPHEHVFVDIRNKFNEFNEATKRSLSKQKVCIRNLDTLSRNPYAIKDNLVLDNEKVAEEEIIRFKKAGGNTMVDATNIGIGRDPEALRNISIATEINIIAGCGYYTYDTHPKDMEEKKQGEIVEELLKDINEGIDNTGIRAGVIGEIGTSDYIHPNEKKVLIASAIVQSETGLPVIIHTYPWARHGLEIIDILRENGANINKVCICHIDIEIDLDYCKKILKTGAYIEFDNFGKEFFIEKRYRGFAGGIFARDIERVKAIKDLIETDYSQKILITCDICLKTLLHRYGGWGYDHVLSNIIPMMKEEEIEEQHINLMVKENPNSFLNIGN